MTNPGLNIALAVELGRRALLALLTREDKIELVLRNWREPAEDVSIFVRDYFALASGSYYR